MSAVKTSWGRPRLLVAALSIALCLASSIPSFAFLPLGVSFDGRLILLRWNEFPVRYFVTNQSAAGVDPAAFQDAVGRAFDSWQAVPTAFASYTFGGFTDALPGDDDGLTTLGFVDRPDLDRVLASTSFLVDVGTGAILESDIFFNSEFQWSVSPTGQAGRYDLETVALHEIGHLSGLGHSALGETEIVGAGRRVIASDAVMFPIAFEAGTTFNRTLHEDDIAGLSALNPTADFLDDTGSLTGHVTKNGQGVYGAHVVAFNPATGVMVGAFSLNEEGLFVVLGLPPGPYVVRVEPLDDADTDSFLDGFLDLDFRVAYFRRLVVVPRAGDSGTIEMAVMPK